MSASVSRRVRRQVEERAQSRCEYCLLPQHLSPAVHEIDHIIPVVDGGESVLENLCLSCRSCNSAKHDHVSGADPESGRLVRLVHPRNQQWSRHFLWNAADGRIVGRTAAGRATVVALQMNDERLVELRLLWAEGGWYPPAD